jgi:formylglycine-generating enzyme required for sulfatase activity
MPTAPLKTFIIYARADAVFKDELLAHLHLFVENALIEKWVDSDLLPGEDWEKTIERELEAAHLVLMLVSADALRSEFIRKKELKTALEKKRAGNARVVPILVRDCMWKLHADLSEIQLLPKDENGRIRGVSGWISRDSAWTSVCDELYTLILELRSALEKGAAEEARRAAEEAEKHRQHAEQERTERSRHRRDEAFWKTVLAETAATDDQLHKIVLYESYLHDPDFRNHRAEAEEAAEEVQAELDTAERRKAAQETALRKREEIERQKREAEAAEKKRIEEAADRQKREAEASEKKRLEAAARQKGLPDMVLVQGGTFQMGEKGVAEPVHAVTLSDFEIGKYPVTQKLWQEIMGANPSHFKGCDDCPVEKVSWDDVQEFLKKLNTRYPGKTYRLPTEAEWEYAARGGSLSKGFVYAGSNDLKEVGWFDENSDYKTHPVGGKKANELGLHDMSGNVWEWCADWYGTYSSGSQTNPTGPTTGSYRVGRGGSWYSYARYCRVSYRGYYAPGGRYFYLGFRLVSSPQ